MLTDLQTYDDEDEDDNEEDEEDEEDEDEEYEEEDDDSMDFISDKSASKSHERITLFGLIMKAS